MADTKHVHKKNFFRFAKTVQKDDDQNSNARNAKAAAAENTNRPRFSSINTGAPRTSVLNMFKRGSKQPGSSNAPSAGGANRPSAMFSLNRLARKSKVNNPNPTANQMMMKPPPPQRRSTTTALFKLIKGSTDKSGKKEVATVNPVAQGNTKITHWVVRYTLSGRRYYWNTREKQHSWEKPEELFTKQDKEDSEREWIWVPHPVHYWQPAMIMAAKKSGAVQVRTLEFKNISINGVKVMKNEWTAQTTQRVPMTPLNRFQLDIVVEDLVELESVNEGTVLYNTRLRYDEGKIYTWIGPSRNVLLAVNPYEDLGLYTEEYKKKYENSATSLDVPEPHVFGVAASCVHKLGAQGKSQSILVSGESGSGKTQATKQCLDFITHIAGSMKVMPVEKPKPVQRAPGKGGRERSTKRKKPKKQKRMMPGQEMNMVMANAGTDNSIEDKILNCNPIMEAFGNAKTVRNNNSSRFGKWIVMYMNMKRRQVTGAKIEQFLLETTRVITQGDNERNYHVFYQVFKDPELVEKYALTDAKDFFYTNQGKCLTVGGSMAIDDKKEMKEVRLAMDKLGFNSDEQHWFFKIVCAVLHLGNVNFESVDDLQLKTTASAVKSDDSSQFHLEKAAEILEMDVEALIPVLTTRTIRTSKDSSTKPLTPKLATAARDALAKAIYGRVFSYLIERINIAFGTENKGRFVGILDIFGFESFEFNSFEQLCINFTNERLQKLFNSSTFIEEQDLYKMERIEFERVDFLDNRVVLDILDTRPSGVFNLLDDECNVPKGNTMNLMKRIANYHADKVKVFKISQDAGTFEVKHFADTVTYHVSDFIVKNKDALNLDLYEVCSNSDDAFTKALFPPLKENEKISTKSTSGKFREQLSELIGVLEDTQCHFIRCMKPNDEQTTKNFNGRKVIDQFKFAAIIDSIETRKKGFAHKMFHEHFFQHYKSVNGFDFKYDMRRDVKARCMDLIKQCFNAEMKYLSGIQLGETRVMFKTEEYKHLELCKTLSVLELVVKVQAAFRGLRARKFYKEFKLISKEVDQAVSQKDLARIEEIEQGMEERLGVIAKKYRIVPKNLEKAKILINQQKLWDPVKEKLTKFDQYNLKKVGDTHEVEDGVLEQLDQAEMEEAMRLIIHTDEQEPGEMPFEVKHSLRRLKILLQLLRDQAENSNLVEALKADMKENEEIVVAIGDDYNDPGNRKTLRQQRNSAKPVAMTSKFAKQDRDTVINMVENEGKTGIEELDRDMLRTVVIRATEYDYTSPTVEKARQLLKMPEMEFLKREVEFLKTNGDKGEAFEKAVALKEMQLIAEFDQYKSFCNLSTLRNPPIEVKMITCFCIPYKSDVKEQSWEAAEAKYGPSAKNRMINRKRKFLVWQNDDFIYFSLLRLPDDLEDIAFKCFEQVFAYMEEFRSEEDGLALIKTGVFMGGGNNAGLRNEIFTQIVKQLINNPTNESRIRGVELLGLCLASFPPDDEEFENFLFTWMRLHLPFAIFRNYMSAFHTLKIESKGNNDRYHGANSAIKENSDLSQIRLLLDVARNNTRLGLGQAPDKWNIPPALLTNILSEYDIDDDFLEDYEDDGSSAPRKSSYEALKDSTYSAIKHAKKSFGESMNSLRKKKKKRYYDESQVPSSQGSAAPLARMEIGQW